MEPGTIWWIDAENSSNKIDETPLCTRLQLRFGKCSLVLFGGLISKTVSRTPFFPSRPGGVSFRTPKVHLTFTVVPKSGHDTDFVTDRERETRIH